MAEGFFRALCGNMAEVHSAGLYPAVTVPAETRHVMLERNIDLSEHFPKAFSVYPPDYFDLIVNMSGTPLTATSGVPVETWNVTDPMGKQAPEFRAARDDIEMRVMNLILRLRTGKLVLRTKPAWEIDLGRASSRQ